MPHLRYPFQIDGPIVELLVGPGQERRDALESAGHQVLSFERARALIDTGSSITCIDHLLPLNVESIGTVPIQTASTAGDSFSFEQYDVALSIWHPKVPLQILTVPLIGTYLLSQGIQALIGRDVLAECLFVYGGVSRTFTLAF